MGLQIFVLGQFKLAVNDIPIELPSRPAQSLLAYLALNAGTTFRREALASLLWADASECNARGYLRQALWRIRKSLKNADLAWENFLEIGEINVTFNRKSDYWLDADQMLSGLGESQKTTEDIIDDIRLYHGELLPGFYDEWIKLERDRIQAAYYQKMGLLLERLIQTKRWSEVLHWGEEWILHGFAPEPAYRSLMVAHANLGNPGMVTLTYKRCVDALEQDLGVEPDNETARLFDQLLHGKQAAPSQPFTIFSQKLTQPPFLTAPNAGKCAEKPLVVAREAELAQLDQFLSQALSGQCIVIFITGEAGSGKTTLIHEFALRAQARCENLIVVSGNCNAHTGVGDPYLPFREILELLTGDVEALWSAGAITQDYAQFLWNLIPETAQAIMEVGPDLLDTFISGAAFLERVNAFTAVRSDWLKRLEDFFQDKKKGISSVSPHQSDLFIQYSKVLQNLSCRSPMVLFLDDLQWADLGSINLLFHLGRHLTGGRILIVGAYRPEEVAGGRNGKRHPLETVINELRRKFGENEVNLDHSENRAFIEAILDSEPNCLGEKFRDMLFDQTRGHPLFTIELLRGMQERGDLVHDEHGFWIEGPYLDWEALPARVEAVIAERLGRLEPVLQNVLRIASIEGETFTVEVVARTQGLKTSELLQRLSNELDRKHRLIRAQSIQRINQQLISSYRFRHILVQKYLYNSMNAVERTHLHEKVGTILEELYLNQAGLGMIAPQLARHFEEAQNINKAIDYLQQSGERALQLCAYHEAIVHLEHGLKLVKSLPISEKQHHQELALNLAFCMAWYLSKGFASSEMEDSANRAYELWLQIGTSVQYGQVLGILALRHYVRAEYHKALALSEKLLLLGEKNEDLALCGLAHWFLGITNFAQGKYGVAREHLERTVNLYKTHQLHHPFLRLIGVDAGLSSLAYLACCLWCLGYPEQALQRSLQALDLGHQLGHSYTLIDVLAYGGCGLNLMRGDAQAVKMYAEEIIQLAQEKNWSGWLACGITCLGEALILLDHSQEGNLLIQEGIRKNLEMQVNCYLTGSMLMLAEGYKKSGQTVQAMTVISETIDIIKKTGERYWEAELYRSLAALQRMQADLTQAEASLLHALEIARQQEARMCELRIALDLAQIWREQGETKAAQELIQGVFSWFSEGFDTPELKLAQKLCKQDISKGGDIRDLEAKNR